MQLLDLRVLKMREINSQTGIKKGGLTWKQLESNMWDTSTVADGTYLLKIVATCSEGYKVETISEPLTIKNEVATTTTTVKDTTTTTTTTPTTTTSTPGTTCPTEELYGNDAPETQLLRDFRDTVLSATPEGQQLINLYYTWSPSLVQAMREDETFKGQLKETVDKILKVIDSN